MEINQPDTGIECIQSALLVKMMRLADERGKAALFLKAPLIVGQLPPPEPKGMKGKKGQIVGTLLLAGAALYFIIHVLIWWVKS